MIKEIAKYQYEIQKSKFIGIAYNIDNLDMVDEILNKLKIENKKAKHICYGYKIEKVDKTILMEELLIFIKLENWTSWNIKKAFNKKVLYGNQI